MFDVNDRQYIVKLSSGKITNIFYKDGAGAYLRSLDKGDTWLTPVHITKDIMPNFDVCVDSTDNIHILYQNTKGNIGYLLNNNGSWSVKSVLKSKNSSIYNKYLTIIHNGQTIILFYVLKYSGRNLLAYQIMDSQQDISEPKVIDYITDSKTPYIVLEDKKGETYIFYRYLDVKYDCIGCKKYIPSRRQWSDFTPITEYDGESEVLGAGVDSNNNIYICWQKILQSRYELMYSVRYWGNEHWEKEKTLTSSPRAFSNCSIAIVNSKIVLYWVEGDDIYYFVSNDKGRTWSKQDKYTSFDGKPLHCISYKSNIADERENWHVEKLPGNLVGSCNLAFINETKEKKQEENTDDLRALLVSALNSLTESVDQIKQSMRETTEKLEALDDKQKQIEGEILKLSARADTVDSEPPNIKAEENLTKEEEINNNENKDDTTGIEDDIPVMPGVGFRGITTDYLRKLQRK
ncbi:MAG: hypothetical protein N3B21_12480 [Clostridia bacterium]|nr:hypothetical protein [Clostridia bacterium]